MDNKELIKISSTEQIFNDVIVAFDEVIATYNYLSDIDITDNRPNQLLFCHVINSFDSFIKILTKTVILSDFKKLKPYYNEKINNQINTTLKQVIDINIIGINDWMKLNTQPLLDTDIRQKRHALILKLLLDNTNINYQNIFIIIGGRDKTGSFKTRLSPSTRKTINHKTTSEELIGYADILYEKRNAITHNNNCYKKTVIQRLNDNWKLQISKSNVIIRQETIKAVIRFYTSVCLELLKSDIFKEKTGTMYKNLSSNIKTLQEFKNITKTTDSASDRRFKSGGIEIRKKALIDSKKTEFNVTDYVKITGVSLTTASRDFVKHKKNNFITFKKRGIWKLTVEKE